MKIIQQSYFPENNQCFTVNCLKLRQFYQSATRLESGPGRSQILRVEPQKSQAQNFFSIELRY